MRYIDIEVGDLVTKLEIRDGGKTLFLEFDRAEGPLIHFTLSGPAAVDAPPEHVRGLIGSRVESVTVDSPYISINFLSGKFIKWRLTGKDEVLGVEEGIEV
jgi:hypothetical protein